MILLLFIDYSYILSNCQKLDILFLCFTKVNSSAVLHVGGRRRHQPATCLHWADVIFFKEKFTLFLMSEIHFEMHLNRTRQRLPTASAEQFPFFITKRSEECMQLCCGQVHVALPGGFLIGAGLRLPEAVQVPGQ